VDASTLEVAAKPVPPRSNRTASLGRTLWPSYDAARRGQPPRQRRAHTHGCAVAVLHAAPRTLRLHEARVALLAQRIARGLEHHHARHVGERLRARAARCVSAAQQHTLRPHARASLQVGHM
jgi:hypothetical protein